MNRLALLFPIAAVALCQSQTGLKETPPPGGPPKPFTVPATKTTALPNGMKITLVPYGRFPKALVMAYVRAGNVNESAQQVWLADVLTSLMKEGAGSRNGIQLAEEAARMGGELEVAAGEDQTHAGIDVLSEFAGDAVRLIADVLQRPALPPSELERIRKDKLRQLAVAKSTPQSLANEAFRKVLFPNHPYGRVFPTEEMLRGYTIEDARKFYQANFGAARTHLYVSGQFDPKVLAVAEESFRNWQRGPAPVENVPKVAAARSLTVIDRPGAVQSTIRFGIPSLNPDSPDYVAFLVTNALLGGSFNSRITSNIREQKGYTYSPSSVLSVRYRNGYWVEAADVTTNVTGPALKEIVNEIRRLREQPPSEQELAGIKNYAAGVFVLQNSSRQGIVNQLAFVGLHGLGEDYLRNFVQKVQAVTPADVQRLAKEYLDPAKMALVVVGDKSKIGSDLEPYSAAAQ